MLVGVKKVQIERTIQRVSGGLAPTVVVTPCKVPRPLNVQAVGFIAVLLCRPKAGWSKSRSGGPNRGPVAASAPVIAQLQGRPRVSP